MKSVESEIEEIIQDHIKAPERYIVGYSFLGGLLPKEYESLQYGITVGMRLDDAIIDRITDGPTREYVNLYHEANSLLDRMGKEIQDAMLKSGSKAVLIKSTLSDEEIDELPEYEEVLAVDFPHKTAATRSGLGWIGKTALFVSKEHGPRLRLVTVLTDKELAVGEPVEESLCGDCDICVKKCPAQAASGRQWTAGMKREHFFDAFSCRRTANALAKKRVGVGDSICGICVAVCPFGKKDKV
ncbi:MAG: epoxyqueuosine reductase [Thermoplasmata archaeon]|nr:MAG: epoxyqueuosine reductase [Thermoplasmata archaeon]